MKYHHTNQSPLLQYLDMYEFPLPRSKNMTTNLPSPSHIWTLGFVANSLTKILEICNKNGEFEFF